MFKIIFEGSEVEQRATANFDALRDIDHDEQNDAADDAQEDRQARITDFLAAAQRV